MAAIRLASLRRASDAQALRRPPGGGPSGREGGTVSFVTRESYRDKRRFAPDVFRAIGNAFASAFRAIGQALNWLGDKLGDAVRFLGKAATYAWETVKAMASNPLGLAMFLMGVAMAIAVPGSSLLVVLLKASAPIVATSLARAAGINNPIVLGLIGLAAGLAVGGAGVKDWLKGGAKMAGEKLVRAVGGDGLAAVYSLADFAVSNVPEGSEGGEAPKGEGAGPGTKGGGSTPAATVTEEVGPDTRVRGDSQWRPEPTSRVTWPAQGRVCSSSAELDPWIDSEAARRAVHDSHSCGQIPRYSGGRAAGVGGRRAAQRGSPAERLGGSNEVRGGCQGQER